MKPSKLVSTLLCSAVLAATACAVADRGLGVGAEADGFNYLSVWESQLPEPAPADPSLRVPANALR